MARKKGHHDSTKDPGAFHPAFQALEVLRVGKAESSSPKPPPEDEGAKSQLEIEEGRYFLEAMRDVRPLAGDRNKIPRIPNPNIRPSHPAPDDELEVLARLSDLVSGTGDMDISFSDEYIEGMVHGFSQKLMDKLKKGQFPIQDHVDLHGLTKSEAEIRVRNFLIQSHHLGLRCLLIIHGRGLNSENHIPVLKERLPVWLSRGPVRKIVLAFSTAMPYDGGTGAIYILLRKNKGRPLQQQYSLPE